MQFEGIYTPVVTPYDSNDKIDYSALETIIDYLINAGVQGLIVAGTTGEYYCQSLAEREALMQHFIAYVNQRVPVIVGTGALRTEDSIHLAECAAKHQADALLIATPPYALPTERENALNALTIDRAANLPVMLYNYPGRMGVNMGEEFLDRVSRSANFQAIKESSGDVNRIHLLARDYAHIQLGCGMDDQALEFFAWGATCWICAGSNFAPKAHLALYEACRLEKDFEKGRRIMMAMLPLMRILEQGGKFIQSIKHGMLLAGLPAGEVRRPLRGLYKQEQRELDNVIQVMQKTINHIQTETRA